MNDKIKEILKQKKKQTDELNHQYALKILEVLKEELKGFNLKNQQIVIDSTMGGIYLEVNGKDFQKRKYGNGRGFRERTWHKHPVFNAWKKLQEVLSFLNHKDSQSWSHYLDQSVLIERKK